MSPRTKRTTSRISRDQDADPYEDQLSGNGRQGNPWLIATVLLAVALVGVIAYILISGKVGGSGSLTLMSEKEATDKLMNFIDTIYGPQIGETTFVSMTKKNGLYEAVVSVNDPQSNQPVDQTIYMTQDGELFIPQVINVDDALSQYQLYLQQQQQQQNTNTATSTDETENTNSNEAQDEETNDTNSNTNANSNSNSNVNGNTNTNTNSDEDQ